MHGRQGTVALQLGAPIYAAPITYMIGDRQYVTIAAGTTITSFALAR